MTTSNPSSLDNELPAHRENDAPREADPRHRADDAPREEATSRGPESTAVFVKRSRSLNLGGMVLIALGVGALAGLVWGLIIGVNSFAPLVIGALYGLVFIGGALAALVVLVDWILEKRGR